LEPTNAKEKERSEAENGEFSFDMSTITFLEELGRGASGVVRKAMWTPKNSKGVLVAVKSMSNVIVQADFEKEVYTASK